MTTAAQPSRLEALGAGNLVRRIVVATVLTLGLLFIIRGLAQRLATSDSPAVYGVLVLGLGLAVAVFYGLWRNTRVGVIVWIVGALLSVTFAGSGLAILDRLTFVALAAGWFISIVTGSQHLRRFGTAEALMVLFLLAHIISTVSPHQLAAFSGLPPSTLIINGVFLPLAAYVIASQSLADPRSIRLFMWFLVGLGFYLG